MSVGVLKSLLPKILSKVDNGELTEALQMCESNNKIASRLIPLRGYIYYRLGQCRRVIDLCRQLTGSAGKTLGILHLLAQCHFKLAQKSGDFKEACSIYDTIAKQYPEDSLRNPEFISNVLAAYIAAHDYDKATSFLNSINFESDAVVRSYESVFNASFIALRKDHFTKAFDQTRQAADLLSDMRDADGDDENDSLTIEYQQHYILQLMKDRGVTHSNAPKTSFDALQSALASQFEHLNHSLRAISTNMQVAQRTSVAKGDRPSDQFKDLEASYNQCQDKLSWDQLQALQYNLVILQAYSKSYQELSRSLNKLQVHQDSSVESKLIAQSVSGGALTASPLAKDEFTALIQIFITLREKNYAAVDGILEAYQSACKQSGRQANRLLMLFTPIYVSLYRNQLPAALEALQTFVGDQEIKSLCPTLANHPAIISLFTSLYLAQKDYHGCSVFIDACLKRLTSIPPVQQNASVKTVIQGLHTLAAEVKVHTGDIDGAIQSLDLLTANADPLQSKHYLVRIVMLCYAHCPERIEQYSARLGAPAPSDLSEIDPEALAARPLPTGQTSAFRGNQSSSAMGDDDGPHFLPNGKRAFTPDKLEAVRLRNKRRRVKRLPAGVTSEQVVNNLKNGVEIDPYRWKPKWERPSAATGTSKKAGGSHLKRGPQGSGISEHTVEFSSTGKVGASTKASGSAHSSASIPAASAKHQARGKKRR